MRPTKLALSALAIAFALGGTAYAATSATPAKPAASSTQTAQASPAPAKHHRLFHRDAKKAPAKTSTSNSTSTKTTGAH
jgi:hypothetical protein